MTTTNWRAFLQPYLDTWKSQGRNAEQIYGVENFLSGQGQLGIEQLISSAHQQWVSEVVERLEGLKMVPTKHEGCYFDDNWCYVHKEIVDRENGEGPNGALQNNRTLDAAISVIQDKSND